MRRLQAEAFGDPGQRTFRLLAETDDGRVSLWLEKEQVVMLGTAIQEVLGRVPHDQGDSPESDILRSFMGELEVKVGSLAIGYDVDHAGFSIESGNFQSAFTLSSITLLASRQQFERVGEEIQEIVARGRPRCALCGTPLTGEPHFCPESNGHLDTKAAD